MKKTILFSFILISFLTAQDSLYLVNTLTGDSVNKIIYAKGAGDINGDGYADLVVSFTDSVKIYLGNAQFELKPAYTFGNNNGFVLCPGDVNNDGYTDLLIGDKRFGTGTHGHISNINLFFGGTDSLDSCTTFGYEVSLWDQVFSRNVDPLGDVNGDGYNDFAISSPYNWDDGISYVYLYLGGDSISSQPFVTFEHSPWIDPSSEGTFGNGVTGIGDQNNDGYDDFLISDPANNGVAGDSGRVYLYYGGTEMDSIADSIFTEDKGRSFGYYIDNLGDINGDGLDAFAISEPGYIYFFKLTDEIFGIHGFLNAGGGGDINNDGYNDFLLGDIQYINENDVMVGAAFIYYGGAENDTVYDYKLEGETQWSDFSRELDIIGDFNKDGYDDFFILAPLYPDDQNETGKFYLYSYKNKTSIDNSDNNIIRNFELLQNYPNPFNNTTAIPFFLNRASKININIYDIRGRLIKTLFSGSKPAGRHKIIWNGKTDSGKEAASGVYFMVMRQIDKPERTQSKKILLVK